MHHQHERTNRISVRNDDFIKLPYHTTELGNARVSPTAGALTLTVPPTADDGYHDAQIADYTLQTRDFRWRTPPPGETLRLTVRAHFSTADVRGTAGFGWWNHPFSPEMRGLPRLPQAAWFFYGSPPNDMPLAQGVPGSGWKAATLNGQRWQFLALAPAAPIGFLLMRVPALYRALWGTGQAALGVREHLLPPDVMTEPHTYTIAWQHNAITFGVDGETVLHSPFALRGTMGFIAWVDNQYAVVTPQGRFGWGLVGVPQVQSLHLQHVSITRVPGGD